MEARREAFKIFAQSAEAAIKGLCADYGHEICARVSQMLMLNIVFLELFAIGRELIEQEYLEQ